MSYPSKTGFAGLDNLNLEDHPRTDGYVVHLPMVFVFVPLSVGQRGTPSKWPFTPWFINKG